MAVAGGTASSIHIVLEDGRLVEHAVMHRPRDLLKHDVDEALAALGEAGGRGIYLALQGYNLPQLRAVVAGLTEPPTLTWRVAAAIVCSMVTGIRFQ